MKLTNDEVGALQKRVIETATERGIKVTRYGTGIVVPGLDGPLIIRVTQAGVRISNKNDIFLARFPGLDAVQVLKYLRDLKERLDVQQLAESLS